MKIAVVNNDNIDSMIAGALLKNKYNMADIVNISDFEYENVTKDDEVIMCGCSLNNGKSMIILNSKCNLRWYDNGINRINQYMNYYNQLNDSIDNGDDIKDELIECYGINPKSSHDKLAEDILENSVIKGELNANKSTASMIWNALYKKDKPPITSIYYAIKDIDKEEY